MTGPKKVRCCDNCRCLVTGVESFPVGEKKPAEGGSKSNGCRQNIVRNRRLQSPGHGGRYGGYGGGGEKAWG